MSTTTRDAIEAASMSGVMVRVALPCVCQDATLYGAASERTCVVD
jgi:hypothetical protein